MIFKCKVGDEGCTGKAKNPNNAVCESCEVRGWTANPIEVAGAIARDPELKEKVEIKSDYD